MDILVAFKKGAVTGDVNRSRPSITEVLTSYAGIIRQKLIHYLITPMACTLIALSTDKMTEKDAVGKKPCR